MQKGAIPKLLSYYLSSDKFKSEIERAQKEFFDIKEENVLLSIEEKYEPFFNEWLVYDFKLQSGKSLLEDYYYRNPKKMPLYEMQIYKDLQTNIYGLIEARKVDQSEGMEVMMINTGEIYYVQEYAATFQAREGSLFYNRVAKVGDHFELVGADSFFLPIKINLQTKKYLKNLEKKLSPKDAMATLENVPETNQNNNDGFDLEEVIFEIDEILERLDIGNMVSAELIRKWLDEIRFKEKTATTPILSILYGLADGVDDKKLFNDLARFIAKLANNSPQKALKGKSPAELNAMPDRPDPSYRFNVTRLGGGWNKHANKSTQLLMAGKTFKASDEICKCFQLLKKEETTGRQIYRIYANKAVCHLSIGEVFLAEQAINIALELNSNYDFALDLRNKINSGQKDDCLANAIRFIISVAESKKLKQFAKLAKNFSDKELLQKFYDISLSDYAEIWQNDPAKIYYDFIKQFGINFKTDKLTETPKFIVPLNS